jgi:hypothetical protein
MNSKCELKYELSLLNLFADDKENETTDSFVSFSLAVFGSFN